MKARDCFEAVGWHALDRLDIHAACRSFKAAKRCDLVPWLCTLEEVEEDVALGAHMKGALLSAFLLPNFGGALKVCL